jgi:hypothetical protein
MRKRNKVALLLILPIAVFIWLVGWSLYCSGSRGNVTETNKATNTGLTFAVLMPEQKYAT